MKKSPEILWEIFNEINRESSWLQTQNSRVSDAPMKKKTNSTGDLKPITRRNFLKGTAAGAATLAIPVGTSDAAVWQSFFQQHFLEMNKEEIAEVIKRLEKDYAEKYKTSFNIKATGALPNTLFGYGLDLSRCVGCRR